MNRPDPFVTADARGEGLDRAPWIVTAEVQASGRGILCLVPADSAAEAIARAVHLAIAGGCVQGAGEIGNVDANAIGGLMREALPLFAGIMQGHGARCVAAPIEDFGIAAAVVEGRMVKPSGRVH